MLSLGFPLPGHTTYHSLNAGKERRPLIEFAIESVKALQKREHRQAKGSQARRLNAGQGDDERANANGRGSRMLDDFVLMSHC